MSEPQKLGGRIMPHYCSFSRDECVRFTNNEAKIKALEAELDGYKQGAKLQAGIDWHQMYVDVLKEREQARDSLAEARKSMVDFHCSTFQNFPDDDHCGSPQARTCGSYYLCQAMKKVLGVNACETCIHFEKMEKLEYAWCPHKGDFLYENHLVCGDYIKRGVGEAKKCPICGESASIRNPTGKCDHLYYPENLDPEKLLLIFKVLEAELQKTEDQVTCEKFAITEGIRDRQKAEENLRIAELYIKNMQEVNKIYEHRLAEAEPSPEMASLILRGLGYISPIPILQPQSEDFKRHIDYLRKKSLRGVGEDKHE